MKTRIIITVLIVFILSMSVNLSTTSAAGEPPIDLGTLGGNWSTAVKTNETGTVIGYSPTDAGETHAFMWYDGVLTDLGTLGGSYSYPYGVNNGAQIIGASEIASGNMHAFLWESGNMTDLGTLGGSYANARDINVSGDIVGCGTVAGDGYWHAIYWKNKEIIDIGASFDGHSCAYSINNRGQVLGYFVTADGDSHSFLYENGAILDLGAFEASMLTDSGKVLGKTTDSNGDVIGVIWDGKQWNAMNKIDGVMDLVLLGMNAHDQVIGYYLDDHWTEHYFLWQKGVYQDLDFIAIGINSNGTILGTHLNHTEGLLWSKPSMSTFSGFEGNSIYPTYIANNGAVTGQCYVQDGYPHACLWPNP